MRTHKSFARTITLLLLQKFAGLRVCDTSWETRERRYCNGFDQTIARQHFVIMFQRATIVECHRY
jgi:hypothetical protein